MQNLKDLKRMKANFAYERIINVKEHSCSTNYKSHVKNIPMYIYKNGLLATVAFILTKKKDEAYQQLLKDIIGYINKDYDGIGINTQLKEDGKQFLEYLSRCSQQKYRRTQISVLSMLEWLVRLSDGMLV